MKKKKLLLFAFFFMSAIILLFSSTHVFDERKTAPVFKQAERQSIRPFKPPYFKLPKPKR